ncbi:MAG: SufD family Fe-S cluster assembly protein [Bacteroidia bacterium]|nr:SufD family Fe-S cluster assembly protein [Bacteroidia bacterium]MDW8235247.1 SufD family Fe-S cluster assembly protein [Bacteroidia bacterium]
MSVFTSEKLSLEAGADHLMQLLRKAAVHPIPSEVSLSTLFTQQRLKEEWKYTPLDFLRYPWELTEIQPTSFPFPLAHSADETNLVPPLPEMRSPWDTLLLHTAHHKHYEIQGESALPIGLHNSGGAAPLLITVYVRANSSAEIGLFVEGKGLSLLRLHLHLEEGAHARLYIPYTEDNPESYTYFLVSAEIKERATLESYDFVARAHWKRSEMRIRLTGKEARAYLVGATLTRSGGMNDFTLRVEHYAPHTESNQFFKSLVHTGGRSVFQGNIYVHPHAQKTNAYQSHKSLLWDAGASAYSRPQLEIFADDVRCTHGVTTGFLQGDMLFYLLTRGIPTAQARQILASAFLNEAVEKIPHPDFRRFTEREMELFL